MPIDTDQFGRLSPKTTFRLWLHRSQSECAFSQGGITINKLRNRLKGDIVEALQCFKCVIQNDLIFHESGPSSAMETNLSDSDNDFQEGDEKNKENDENWDAVVDDEDVLAFDEEDDEDFGRDIESDSEYE